MAVNTSDPKRFLLQPASNIGDGEIMWIIGPERGPRIIESSAVGLQILALALRGPSTRLPGLLFFTPPLSARSSQDASALREFRLSLKLRIRREVDRATDRALEWCYPLRTIARQIHTHRDGTFSHPGDARVDTSGIDLPIAPWASKVDRNRSGQDPETTPTVEGRSP